MRRAGGWAGGAIRVAALLGMALWAGGFTFYGGVVVGVLHEFLDTLLAGEITREVTDRLNVVGLVAAGLAWGELAAGRACGGRRLRAGLLAVSSLLLAAQFGMHEAMERRLDAGELGGFYPWHRAYLIASTVQWAANVGWIAVVGGGEVGRRVGDVGGERAP